MQVRSVDRRVKAEPPAYVPSLTARGAVIGPSRVIRPDRIVYVVPEQYAQLNLADRATIARVIGKINRASTGRSVLLLGPGRWGTRDAWLGIPVALPTSTTSPPLAKSSPCTNRWCPTSRSARTSSTS